MFPFDPTENIKKRNISYPPDTHTHVCVSEGEKY